jgi:hypothetical protein
MSPNTRLLLYALGAVVALIVLIARFKLHPFVVLIVVSLALGIAVGMPLGAVVSAFQNGVATVLGFIAIVVALGTMLGKLMAESGGATRIATTLIARFGERRVHWALMFVGFIVGIPVFFQVGFVLLIPLVFTRVVADQDRDSARRGIVGGAWDGAAPPGRDACRHRLPRRRGSHRGVRDPGGAAHRCIGRADLRLVGSTTDSAAG